jgi:hypothetical protein
MDTTVEYRLLDLVQFINTPNDLNTVENALQELKSNKSLDGEISISESTTTKGIIVRYTNIKDWIQFVNCLVENNKDKGTIVIVDCGYQFTKLFKLETDIMIAEYEDIINGNNNNNNNRILELDEHIAVTIWSNVGLLENYSEQVKGFREKSGPVLGTMVLGVFVVRE